ncbi:MAG: response regulator transcription factor [Anaerolineae bacterium]|nr:response regulator transcription factor [Anaerolineae bacterium]
MVNGLQPLRVLIAAVSPLARAGLTALLSDHESIQIVGQVDDVLLAESISVYRPEVVIWDLGYAPQQHLEQMQELRDAGVVVLGLTADKWGAVEILPALVAAGLRGLLPQDVSSDVLISAIQSAAGSLLVVDAEVGEMVFSHANIFVSTAEQDAVEAFTPREREVLSLVAEGLPNKIIARQLNISEHTVKFHLNAILTKLGAQSRTEAVVRATRLGLIAL